MNKRALDVLHVAKGLISHPKRWIKGKPAANEFGSTAFGDDATCWCATGSIERAASLLNTYDGAVPELISELNAIAQERGFYSIVAMNDNPYTSHSDIISAFDEAERRLQNS